MLLFHCYITITNQTNLVKIALCIVNVELISSLLNSECQWLRPNQRKSQIPNVTLIYSFFSLKSLLIEYKCVYPETDEVNQLRKDTVDLKENTLNNLRIYLLFFHASLKCLQLNYIMTTSQSFKASNSRLPYLQKNYQEQYCLTNVVVVDIICDITYDGNDIMASIRNCSDANTRYCMNSLEITRCSVVLIRNEEMLIIFFMISCALDMLENLEAVDLDDVAATTPASRNLVKSMKDENVLRGTDHSSYHLHEECLKIEDLLIRSPNFWMYKKLSSEYPYLDKLFCSTRMLRNFNHFIKCLCFILDTIEVYKGRMLYATPQNCIIDHYVIIISTFKGKAICLAPFYYTYHLYFIYGLLKNNAILLASILFHILSLICHNYATLGNCIENRTFKFKLGNNKLLVQYPESSRFVGLASLDITHLDNNIYYALMHDIEVNPGPSKRASLKIITFNCRGLNNIDKCRLLLNKVNKIIDNGQAVVLLQETMIVTDNYLNLAWRGKHIHTPGNGNSQGCITLFPSTVEIISTEHFGTRGHCAQVTGLTATDETVAIYNIYAPNGFGQDKLEFITSLFEKMSTLTGNIILGGDINTMLSHNDRHNRGLSHNDRHNRGVTTAERRIASLILDKTAEYDLSDVWGDSDGFTWHRGKVMSKLDRIFYRLENYMLKSNEIDWTGGIKNR
jgi:exonuclease III